MFKARQCFLFVVLFVMLISFTAAQSWSASPFEGKTIKIVCGYDPGGGYDRMSRLLAKHLPKYIPGKPVFVVENMPGAATIVAGELSLQHCQAGRSHGGHFRPEPSVCPAP